MKDFNLTLLNLQDFNLTLLNLQDFNLTILNLHDFNLTLLNLQDFNLTLLNLRSYAQILCLFVSRYDDVDDKFTVLACADTGSEDPPWRAPIFL
jgi:hypothetical protein